MEMTDIDVRTSSEISSDLFEIFQHSIKDDECLGMICRTAKQCQLGAMSPVDAIASISAITGCGSQFQPLLPGSDPQLSAVRRALEIERDAVTTMARIADIIGAS
jgi:hypothetical protein